MQTIEQAKHTKQLAVCIHERHRQELLHLVFLNNFGIRARQTSGVLGPEDLFRAQSLGGDALGKDRVHAARFSAFHSVAHLELIILQQGDETAPKAEKPGGPHDKRLEKTIQIAAGAQFQGNLKKLMKFLGLRMCGGMELRVGHRYRAEAGNGCDERTLFGRENPILTRINQDGALGARATKRCRDQHAWRNQVAQ